MKTFGTLALFIVGVTGHTASRPEEIPFEKHTLDLDAYVPV